MGGHQQSKLQRYSIDHDIIEYIHDSINYFTIVGLHDITKSIVRLYHPYNFRYVPFFVDKGNITCTYLESSCYADDIDLTDMFKYSLCPANRYIIALVNSFRECNIELIKIMKERLLNVHIPKNLVHAFIDGLFRRIYIQIHYGSKALVKSNNLFHITLTLSGKHKIHNYDYKMELGDVYTFNDNNIYNVEFMNSSEEERSILLQLFPLLEKSIEKELNLYSNLMYETISKILSTNDIIIPTRDNWQKNLEELFMDDENLYEETIDYTLSL